MFYKKKKLKAFTLIEVLTALTLFVSTILAVTTLTLYSVKTNQRNVHSLQAQYLASEGLEAIREIRDSNYLQNYYWLGKNNDLLGGTFENVKIDGVYFTVSPNNQISGELGPWILKAVLKDSDNDLAIYKNGLVFGHDKEGEKTIFKRYIFIKPVLDTVNSNGYYDKIYVESVVTFLENTEEKELKLFTTLTNFRD
jgi:type II secretory pathway pseudopilin PulG